MRIAHLQLCVRPSTTALDRAALSILPVGVQDGRNMVAWLGETVAQALEAATQHTARQKAIRALSASIKERFQLADILVSPWGSWQAQAGRLLH